MAEPVTVVVSVPRCSGETLTQTEINAIKNAILADNLHTLVHAHAPCLQQSTTVRVETHTINI